MISRILLSICAFLYVGSAFAEKTSLKSGTWSFAFHENPLTDDRSASATSLEDQDKVLLHISCSSKFKNILFFALVEAQDYNSANIKSRPKDINIKFRIDKGNIIERSAKLFNTRGKISYAIGEDNTTTIPVINAITNSKSSIAIGYRDLVFEFKLPADVDLFTKMKSHCYYDIN